MKKNDFLEIKNLTIENLLKKIKVSKQEVADLILDKNMNKLKDLKSVLKKRHEIAQMMTVLNQKKLLEKLEASVKKEEKISKSHVSKKEKK
ncbi:50S ribosomal protein L29 [Candidatus Daviesbacteria bacterium]|nr:50S ribosomal protein L29 [Candidatus Daviesbacteria bacterium]